MILKLNGKHLNRNNPVFCVVLFCPHWLFLFVIDNYYQSLLGKRFFVGKASCLLINPEEIENWRVYNKVEQRVYLAWIWEAVLGQWW